MSKLFIFALCSNAAYYIVIPRCEIPNVQYIRFFCFVLFIIIIIIFLMNGENYVRVDNRVLYALPFESRHACVILINYLIKYQILK